MAGMSRGDVVSQSAGAAGAGRTLGYLGSQSALPWPGSGVRSRLASIARYWAAHRGLCAAVGLGAVAAAAVGYVVAQNPAAGPAHVAVPLRVAIIATLIAAGAYAQTNTGQVRMGVLLVAVGFYASLWLLNGASEPALFGVGMVLAGLAPAAFAYLLLAYPSGRLRSSGERWLLLGAGGAMLVCWTFLVLTNTQPPITTPLLDCGPHCPANPLFLGSTGSVAVAIATAGLWLSWGLVALGTPMLLSSGLRNASEPVRRSFVPLELAAVAGLVFWIAFAATSAAESSSASAFGAAYVETAVAVPLVILAGLFVERLSMGRALATFVTQLVERPNASPEALLARALKDRTLKIAYYEPRRGIHVDGAGRPAVVPEDDEHRAVAHVERGGARIAAVSYDAALADQAAFVEAAGAVAAMHLEASQLEANLTESYRELAASRHRLVEAADTERQRIERDLHDGVQQYIVGLRLRLDLAAETVRDDPARGQQMLGAIGRQVDELLGALRSFAAGIYPAVLTERGLKAALESAARSAPCPISLHTFGLERYPEDIEVAVYFCCVEALQNVIKHAGPDADTRVRVWHIGDALAFDIRDSGTGFDSEGSSHGHGLINMRDRIEAVGGSLWVSSREHSGTRVRGRIPLGMKSSANRR